MAVSAVVGGEVKLTARDGEMLRGGIREDATGLDILNQLGAGGGAITGPELPTLPPIVSGKVELAVKQQGLRDIGAQGGGVSIQGHRTGLGAVTFPQFAVVVVIIAGGDKVELVVEGG